MMQKKFNELKNQIRSGNTPMNSTTCKKNMRAFFNLLSEHAKIKPLDVIKILQKPIRHKSANLIQLIAVYKDPDIAVDCLNLLNQLAQQRPLKTIEQLKKIPFGIIDKYVFSIWEYGRNITLNSLQISEYHQFLIQADKHFERANTIADEQLNSLLKNWSPLLSLFGTKEYSKKLQSTVTKIPFSIGIFSTITPTKVTYIQSNSNHVSSRKETDEVELDTYRISTH